jgi:hypothetical protein
MNVVGCTTPILIATCHNIDQWGILVRWACDQDKQYACNPSSIFMTHKLYLPYISQYGVHVETHVMNRDAQENQSL